MQFSQHLHVGCCPEPICHQSLVPPQNICGFGACFYFLPKKSLPIHPNNLPPLSKSASPPVLKRALELVEPIPEGDLITLLTTFVGLYCHGIQHDLHNNEAVPSLWFRPGIKLGIWTFTVMLLSWSPFNGVLKVNLVLQFVMVGFFFKVVMDTLTGLGT